MLKDIFRFEFTSDVDIEDVEATLLLTSIAVENLHGASEARRNACHYFDKEKRVCVIDRDTELGTDFCKLFYGLLRREFSPKQYHVEWVGNRVPELVA